MTGVASAITATAVAAGATIYSANKAAGAQESAAQNASNTQLQMLQMEQAQQAPWTKAGGAAVGALGAYYGLPGYKGLSAQQIGDQLASLPGYQFQMQQGTQAIDRSAAAKGLLNSGATGKALTQFGQGLASSTVQNQYLNGLQSLAGLGQTGVSNTNALAAQAAGNIGSAQIYAGNAAAGGYAGMASGVNQGIYGLAGLPSYFQQGAANANGASIAAEGYGSQAAGIANSIPIAPIDFTSP